MFVNPAPHPPINKKKKNAAKSNPYVLSATPQGKHMHFARTNFNVHKNSIRLIVFVLGVHTVGLTMEVKWAFIV